MQTQTNTPNDHQSVPLARPLLVIGGGNMGGAIVTGAVRARVLAGERVVIVDPNPEKHTPFEALRMRYFNAVGALGWWVRYRLLRRSILGGDQYSVMNRVVPVMRALESRVPPPFGLSLAVTCRRRPDA